MRRERLRDAAFATAIAIVLMFVSLAIWQKPVDCSSQGGDFVIIGLRGSMDCRLPDRSVDVP